jgi:hypothetical protein
MSRIILPSVILAADKILKKGGKQMKKIDLLDPKIVRLTNSFSDEILNIIDNSEEFTRSDLQGAIDAIVIKILRAGLNLS